MSFKVWVIKTSSKIFTEKLPKYCFARFFYYTIDVGFCESKDFFKKQFSTEILAIFFCKFFCQRFYDPHFYYVDYNFVSTSDLIFEKENLRSIFFIQNFSSFYIQITISFNIKPSVCIRINNILALL